MAAPLREEPWSEQEINNLLGEILKHSQLPSHTLLDLIGRFNVQPAWNHLFLPHGRSLHSCQTIYANLSLTQRRYTGTVPPVATMSPIGPVPIPQVPRKRPSTYGETPPSTGRQLQPRPSFTPMNNGEDPGPQLSPDQSSDPNQPARKKRGRPTKAEAEERKRDAMAKGIPYPQQRTPKTPKPLKPLEGGSSTDPTTAPGGSTAATPATSGPPPLSALAPAPPLSSTPVTAPFQPPSAPILSTPDPSPANKRKRPKKSEESTPNPMGIGGPSSALSSLSTQPVHGQMSSSPARRSPVRLAPRTEGLTRTAEVPMTMLLEGSEGRRPGALTTSGPSAAAPPPPPTQNPAGPLPQAEPQSRPPPQESIQTSQPPRELPK